MSLTRCAGLAARRVLAAAPVLAIPAVVSAVLAAPVPAGGGETGARSSPSRVPEGLLAEAWEEMRRRVRVDRSGLRGARAPRPEAETAAGPPVGEDAKLTASDGEPGFPAFAESVAVSGDTVVVGLPGGAGYVFVEPAGGWSGALVESATLLGSDVVADDFFGFSVAISGDTVVVGAPAGGKRGGAGAAYVFVRPAGGWSGALMEDAKLAASDGADDDFFGSSVTISGATVAAGAPGDDDSGNSSGSSYVFVRPVGGWTGTLTEDAKLAASDAAEDDQFGTSVAVSGDTVVAGTPGDDDSGSSSGSAYVFVRPPGGWGGPLTEDAKLLASDGEESDFFGFSVALSGDTVLAGARFDDDNGPSSGSAYVFVEPLGGWSGTLTEAAKLLASDGGSGDELGFSVALSGATAVVGARLDDDNGNGSGSAYVFVEPLGGWSGTVTEGAKLLASDGSAGDDFGRSVAVADDTAVVGAPGDDGLTGSAYVFSGVSPEIFSDGFESGDTSAWSQTVS